MIWLDAQLSPLLATWISKQLDIPCKALRDIGLRDASDKEIYAAAKSADVIIMSKDSDFLELLILHKSPPKIIWLTCGNTSNNFLKQILETKLPEALKILGQGNDLVEIAD